MIEDLGIAVEVRRQGVTDNVPLRVFTGLEEEDKELPSVTLAALNGQEFPQSSGNFTLTLSATVRTNADETDLAEHRRLCESALAPLMDADTETNLSAAEPDFGCLGISNRQSMERIEDRAWVTELSLDAYCCGLALT